MNGWRDFEMEQELNVEGLDRPAAERVFGHLTQYLEKPLPEIASVYWQQRKTADAEAQRRAAAGKNTEEVNQYYAETSQYLYELSYWEATRDKQKWLEVLRQACLKTGRKKVLDFGGGVGGVTLALRRAGIACDHLDIPGNTSTYASWRFSREKFPAQVWDARGAIPEGTYDAVVAWDVFEHLYDVGETLERIRNLLRPGGWLLSKSTFAETDQHHIHLQKNYIYHDIRVWNRLLEENGFGFIGQLKQDPVSRLLEKTTGWHRPLGVRIVHKLKHGGNFLVHEKGRTS